MGVVSDGEGLGSSQRRVVQLRLRSRREPAEKLLRKAIAESAKWWEPNIRASVAKNYFEEFFAEPTLKDACDQTVTDMGYGSAYIFR